MEDFQYFNWGDYDITEGTKYDFAFSSLLRGMNAIRDKMIELCTFGDVTINDIPNEISVFDDIDAGWFFKWQNKMNSVFELFGVVNEETALAKIGHTEVGRIPPSSTKEWFNQQYLLLQMFEVYRFMANRHTDLKYAVKGVSLGTFGIDDVFKLEYKDGAFNKEENNPNNPTWNLGTLKIGKIVELDINLDSTENYIKIGDSFSGYSDTPASYTTAENNAYSSLQSKSYTRSETDLYASYNIDTSPAEDEYLIHYTAHKKKFTVTNNSDSSGLVRCSFSIEINKTDLAVKNYELYINDTFYCLSIIKESVTIYLGEINALETKIFELIIEPDRLINYDYIPDGYGDNQYYKISLQDLNAEGFEETPSEELIGFTGSGLIQQDAKNYYKDKESTLFQVIEAGKYGLFLEDDTLSNNYGGFNFRLSRTEAFPIASIIYYHQPTPSYYSLTASTFEEAKEKVEYAANSFPIFQYSSSSRAGEVEIRFGWSSYTGKISYNIHYYPFVVTVPTEYRDSSKYKLTLLKEGQDGSIEYVDISGLSSYTYYPLRLGEPGYQYGDFVASFGAERTGGADFIKEVDSLNEVKVIVGKLN